MTPEEAVDEILALFQEAWATTNLKAFYEGKEDDRNSNNQSFAMVNIRHTIGRNAAIGDLFFRREGLLYVQIFVPTGNGLSESYQLAKVVLDAYEGKRTPGGAWFRNCRMNESGRDGTFSVMAVIIEFVYHEEKGA
jgi:hypothetical protein